MTLSPQDLADLKRAKALLENPSLAVRLQGALGRPIEEGMKWLPDTWMDTVRLAAEAALGKALDVALRSLPDREGKEADNVFHKVLAATSGAAGGALGLAGLPFELPISTVIMLRSVADIARSEGEDIKALESRLACLEVFALGSKGSDDEAVETAYYVMRTLLSSQITDAARALAGKTTADSALPAVTRLLATLGSRFGVVVSEKAVATAIPVLGAAGGALVNTLFMAHYQDAARGHFIVRRLERTHGQDVVKTAYGALGAKEAKEA